MPLYQSVGRRRARRPREGESQRARQVTRESLAKGIRGIAERGIAERGIAERGLMRAALSSINLPIRNPQSAIRNPQSKVCHERGGVGGVGVVFDEVNALERE